jgi:ferredoxin
MFISSLLLQQSIKNIVQIERIVDMSWKIDNNRCLRCGGCVSVCPTSALELRDNVIYDNILCKLCGFCEKACPLEAIKVSK